MADSNEKLFRSITENVCESIGDNGNSEVICKRFKEFRNRCTITIKGKEILILNPKKFVDIARSANNFEVYPMADESIEANITFHSINK